jgi:Asp-tRNA(Asn)/Glu-tRNA(Gln) amidotransferase A subunit family amidase
MFIRIRFTVVLETNTLPDSYTPYGSSSSSGAGATAGFAPVSIGTESDGSLVQPGTRAGLYG